jgi:aryl-alcohol dehydrogenase-like predicted oxidoreductase
VQPHYNLVERDFERTLLPVADAWDLAVLPYYALAKGFLTGKYRPGGEAVDSERAEAARAFLHKGGAPALDALDEVAAATRPRWSPSHSPGYSPTRGSSRRSRAHGPRSSSSRSWRLLRWR